MGFRDTEIDKLLIAARIADSAAAHVRPGAREPENGPAVTRRGVQRAAEVSGLGECARCWAPASGGLTRDSARRSRDGVRDGARLRRRPIRIRGCPPER